MENKSRIIWIVLVLAVCGYYLSFTARYWLEQNYMEGLPSQERQEYMENNQGEINNLRNNVLNLGLDLQGGMHTTLEIGTEKLVTELASNYIDSTLIQVIDEAKTAHREKGTDIIDEMALIFEQNYPDARLSRYYRSDSDNITRRSSNEEVVQFLKEQRDKAVDRAMEIIRTRVDRYGVNEPSILKQGNNRIVVELPGVSDKERVRNLLKGTARLQFHLVVEPQEISSAKDRINNYFEEQAQDTAASDTVVQQSANKLLEVFNLQGTNQYSFGYAQASDTARVNELLFQPDVMELLPRNTTLMWSASPIQVNADNGAELYEMIPVIADPELTGEVIEEASVNFDPTTNQPQVSMNMNSEGARRWARITGANINKPVAIVLDNYVYSYPTVQNKISSGRSSISGLADVQEAEDLVNILLSGALPAPLDIIEERTVGATLGEASIKAGFYSVLIGLVIVALFMIFYYKLGGFIADLALVTNIIIILGILAAFKATLTLPGIAGIVLTIGMAVDANVLIFDRIREESRSGKTMIAAIDSGYKNAMSAIMDSNITTFFVGIILYSFGVGPIKGFAVTLMAGIAASLFTAIIISRVIVDYLTREKGREVSFG